jgi:hypothetical protein
MWSLVKNALRRSCLHNIVGGSSLELSSRHLDVDVNELLVLVPSSPLQPWAGFPIYSQRTRPSTLQERVKSSRQHTKPSLCLRLHLSSTRTQTHSIPKPSTRQIQNLREAQGLIHIHLKIQHPMVIYHREFLPYVYLQP